MTAMVHSSPYVSSRSRGYNPRSPSITNGYAFVLLLSALATAVAFSGTSHSIVYSTYNENAPAAYKAKAKVLYFLVKTNTNFEGAKQRSEGSR